MQYIWDDNINNQVKDVLQLLTHEVLLEKYNEEAAKEGWAKEKMHTWKRCWYGRLGLKGQWKFKIRKENCCPKCLQHMNSLREVNTKLSKVKEWGDERMEVDGESDARAEKAREYQALLKEKEAIILEYEKHVNHAQAVIEIIQAAQKDTARQRKEAEENDEPAPQVAITADFFRDRRFPHFIRRPKVSLTVTQTNKKLP